MGMFCCEQMGVEFPISTIWDDRLHMWREKHTGEPIICAKCGSHTLIRVAYPNQKHFHCPKSYGDGCGFNSINGKIVGYGHRRSRLLTTKV